MTHPPTVKIAPSILSADLGHLAEQLKDAEAAGADLFHIDCMDGMFVPNITFGPNIVKACRKVTDLELDVHLMIEKPERYIEEFVDAGADTLTLQAEATPHVHRALQAVKDGGAKAGLAVNPLTPLSYIKEALPYLDRVLIMSVNPGFGGQSFIPSSLARIQTVAGWIDEGDYAVDIEVDGGVNTQTIKAAAQAGATVMVAGSAIYNSASIKDNILALRAAIS